jgi:ParB family transcriptional regulator, chromosome partitioning protein
LSGMIEKKTRGLGKGLDALFPSASLKDDVLEVRPNGIREVELQKISANKNQPRRKFDVHKIEELAFSIKEHGVLQPIVLRETSDRSSYVIIAGERRFRAAKKAGMKTIPAIVRTASELQQLEMALVENIQREDLDPIDQALSIRRLHDEFSQEYSAIAQRLGKAETTVVNLVRLLRLPAPYQAALQDGKMTEGHARALLSVEKSTEAQSILFQHIINDHWSVRKAELYAVAHKNGMVSEQSSRRHLLEETKETKRLSKRLAAEVRIKRKAKGGHISIHFKDDNELHRLLSEL